MIAPANPNSNMTDLCEYILLNRFPKWVRKLASLYLLATWGRHYRRKE